MTWQDEILKGHEKDNSIFDTMTEQEKPKTSNLQAIVSLISLGVAVYIIGVVFNWW